ncbi:MAG: hypothetical protein GF329_19135 [Candidatus Lokiarchaeota archaeon]|nr:hypothetical protein [Candidatus Lokiarchaeota archaeon]
MVGGGRPAFLLPNISEEKIMGYINDIHRHDMTFSYLLNAPCMNNAEYQPEFHRELINYIQWIEDIGTDNVIITIPFLIQLIHEQFPKLKIRVSTIANVNSVNRAKFYARMGAKEITPDVMINRDFETLKRMKNALKKYNCDIVLLLTDGCLFQCPFRNYHYNILGHSSQLNQQYGCNYIDTCILNCSITKFSEPAEVLKARWVRPEDLSHYESIGIEKFKIAGRRMSTEWIIRSVKAFSEQKYEGNLVDIIQGFSMSYGGLEQQDPNKRLRESVKNEQKTKLIIDNTKLDGFIDFFKEQNCNAMCDECNYCEEWAKKVVILDKERSESYVKSLKAYLYDIITSKEFGIRKDGEEKKMTETRMKWNPKTKEMFEKLILLSPKEFQKMARMVISQLAEEKANSRGSDMVENEDMVKAFLEGTPDPFQSDMRDGLRRYGFNV